MIRFIHITDTHIGPTPHFSLYGRQPLQYLQRLIHRINGLPFDIDFVLHTGDLVDDGRAESYALLKETMAHLRFPVKYVVGNHDNCSLLQSVMLDAPAPCERFDYTFDAGGIKFVVLDTRGPVDPGGELRPPQLEWLRSHCTADGPPLVIAMHHVAVPLDTAWLDAPPPDWGGRHMFIRNAADLLQTLKPAAARIRGVFSGHVHGTYQSLHQGMLFVAGQSGFAGLSALPTIDRVGAEEDQSPLFNIVTITENQTIVRQRCFELAK